MKRRVVSMLLVAGMALSALAGCGQDTSKDTQKQDTQQQVESSAQESEQESKQEEEEVVTVTWAIKCDPQEDDEEVLEALNELLRERYNLELNLLSIPNGEFNDRMRLMITSNEDWDLCFTANHSNNFYDNLNMGAFLPLNDLLETETGKKLMEVYPEGLYNVATYNGNIYALPNYQLIYSQNAVYIQKDLMDKYGLDYENYDVITDLVSDEKMVKFMEDVRDNEEDMYVLKEWGSFGSAVDKHYDSIVFGDVAAFIDGSWEATFLQEDEKWLEHKKGMNQLYKDGFIRSDVATVTDNSADVKSGRYAMQITTGKPDGPAYMSNEYGEEYVMLYFGEDGTLKPTLSIDAGVATMTAINVNSKNPEAALKMYTVFWTDPEIYNMFLFGLEGENYTVPSEGRVELIADSGYDRSGKGWMVGNQFNAWLLPGQEDGVWEKTDELNRKATPCYMAGFTFNQEPVSTELAQISSVASEYDKGYLYADDVDKWAKEYAEKLKAAGAQTVIDEVQKQLDEWRVANGK